MATKRKNAAVIVFEIGPDIFDNEIDPQWFELAAPSVGTSFRRKALFRLLGTKVKEGDSLHITPKFRRGWVKLVGKSIIRGQYLKYLSHSFCLGGMKEVFGENFDGTLYAKVVPGVQ